MKLIDEAIVANIIKSVIFNGKVAFRIIRADSNPEKQEDNSHVAQNDLIEHRNCCAETGVIQESQTPPDDQQISNMLTIIKNFRSLLEAAEKRFMKIEDRMIGFGNPITAINPNTTQDNFYTNLLKNWISELWKQLAGKNAIIKFLSPQIIPKHPDLQKNKNIDNSLIFSH